MNIAVEKKKRIEYGDFQTPKELADLVCEKLLEIGVSPEIIIEPTCGLGEFFESATVKFPNAKKIIGIEINDEYLTDLKVRSNSFLNPERLEITNGDFFKFDWNGLLNGLNGEILVLGNFPWVTNAQQGVIGGLNLPDKTNFQNHNGFDAMTGKSNFDISEFMLMKVADWFQKRNGCLAMLVKTSVARKFISHLHKTNIGLTYSAIYKIDAMKYFGAAVDACLLYCQFDSSTHNYDYEVYDTISSQTHYRVGHRHGLTVKNLDVFEKLGYLLGHSDEKWRSGIKHDCSEVMELTKKDGKFFNGLNELVDIEESYIYPLIKGSDVANDRVSQTQRFMIVPQKTVGESTKPIKLAAPKTWDYLESHAKYLDARKSKIYKSNPRYSIFGVGAYTFSSWKIAICGLYKNLNFRLVGQIQDKPVVFDDTVYLLSFDDYDEAKNVLGFLYEQDTQDFLSALVFWDDKRPIKTSILNNLKLNTQRSLIQQPQLF